MNSTFENSATFNRYSKLGHNFHHNIGKIDMDNGIETSETVYTISIEFEHYALMAFVILVLFSGFISLYVYFFKWVAKGNLDLPRFGGGSDVVFNCFPQQNSLRKSDSTQILNDSLDNTTSQESFDNVGLEDKDSTEIMEFDCETP